MADTRIDTGEMAVEGEFLKDKRATEFLPFLSGVIHQLRNWMGGIMGHSDLALASEDPGEMKESLGITLDITNQVSELLDILSRYRNEHMGDSKSGDLSSIGREARVLTDNWLKEKGLDVSEELGQAPAELADLSLIRLALIESINRVVDIIPAGESVQYNSGIVDGRPFVGFNTRTVPGKLKTETLLPDRYGTGIEFYLNMKDSGDCSVMLFPKR